MVHIIASLASLLIAVGALIVIARTLMDNAGKIRFALGLDVPPIRRAAPRIQGIRPAARQPWAAPPALRLRAA